MGTSEVRFGADMVVYKVSRFTGVTLLGVLEM